MTLEREIGELTANVRNLEKQIENLVDVQRALTADVRSLMETRILARSVWKTTTIIATLVASMVSFILKPVITAIASAIYGR